MSKATMDFVVSLLVGPFPFVGDTFHQVIMQFS